MQEWVCFQYSNGMVYCGVYNLDLARTRVCPPYADLVLAHPRAYTRAYTVLCLKHAPRKIVTYKCRSNLDQLVVLPVDVDLGGKGS